MELHVADISSDVPYLVVMRFINMVYFCGKDQDTLIEQLATLIE